MHATISPAILYCGSIVVLISTTNPNSTSNLAVMSSAWFLSHRCMLGLARTSQTTHNLLRTKQCVLNLPSSAMGAHINALTCTTGTKDIPPWKRATGYRYVEDKFGCAGLTPQASMDVRPPRVGECPIQMEAELVGVHEMGKGDREGVAFALEVRILKVHVEEGIRLAGHANRIDPDKWRPMVMSFQELYGLADEKVVVSKLAQIPEEAYRPVEVAVPVLQTGDVERRSEAEENGDGVETVEGVIGASPEGRFP
ncbi:hypothetical protein MMC30_003260 [Trapelia coarctata]|nr:hypothetical protein [Trapelia coarctata]